MAPILKSMFLINITNILNTSHTNETDIFVDALGRFRSPIIIIK